MTVSNSSPAPVSRASSREFSRAAPRFRLAGPLAAVLLAVPAGASAAAASPEEPARAAPAQAVRPPPINVDYVQFGVAFLGEFKLDAGAVCPSTAKAPCILGNGGGLAARAGYRSRGPWFVGGAYEFARIDTSSLLRLGVLQQLRAEMRYYVDLGLRTEPYLTSGLGAVAFGNEWGIDTAGVTSFAGVGFEVQLSRTTVVGADLVYRPLLLFGWQDRAHQLRDTGVASYLGLEVVLEAREPLGSH
jgi:opacity protein-like surface antigen